MKLRLVTQYSNIDEKWLEWYLSRLEQMEELRGVTRKLRREGFAEFSSEDPTSKVVASTSYRIFEEDEYEPSYPY